MSGTRQIPPQRVCAFFSLARATRLFPVLVICKNRTVERQYVRGIKAAGGNVANLRFLRGEDVA